MLDFLTEELQAALRHVNINRIYEIRVRAGKPVIVNYGGSYTFLGKSGVTQLREDALVAAFADVEAIVYRASEYSLYSVTEQLRQGFLTGACGERIGLAGIFVYQNGVPFTVKEITSLNIRVPHDVPGCGELIYRKCLQDKIRSTLLLSAPGRGKTTILRDLARRLSQGGIINILINDERNEIAAAYRDFSMDTGAFTDIVRYTYKRDALTVAVRSMRPDLIVTDELVSAEESEAVAACIRGGISVIASAHCKDIDSLRNAPAFTLLHREQLFERYVFLSAEQIGKVAAIYDAALRPIYECLC